MTQRPPRSTKRSADAPALAGAKRLLDLRRRATKAYGRAAGGKKTADAIRDRVGLLPEEIAATAMLGAALSSIPELIDRLVSGRAVVVVLQAPDNQWADEMAKCAEACFLSPPEESSDDDGDWQSIELTSLKRSACVVHVYSSRRKQNAYDAAGSATRAIAGMQPVLGIAASPKTELPPDILRTCDHRVSAAPLDADFIALVVEEVVGVPPPRPIQAELVRYVELSDIRLALHRDRGPDGCIARLEEIVRPRTRREATGPSLEDLAGYGSARTWGLEVAEDIQAYVGGGLAWSEIDRGALLWGPPGTGKTLFASALARQAGVPLVVGSLGHWQSVGEAHLGTTLKAMRGFFDQAKAQAPCIALIDELDSFGDRSSFSEHHKNYATQIVNGLLECLDGNENRKGVVMIGTTNLPGGIDPAITRSGRFDRSIEIPLPGVDDLADILRHHLGDDLASMDLREAAFRAVGGSGADCAAWVRRARARARRGKRQILLADLLVEISQAPEKPDPVAERHCAVHEAGHTVAAVAHGLKVEAISLDPRRPDQTGFMTFELSRGPITTTSCRTLLQVALAGRAAEVLLLDEASAGAADDLLRSTEIARSMVHRWGLADRLSVCEPSPWNDHSTEGELQDAFREVTALIARRRETVSAIADLLITRRRLRWEDLEEFFDAPPDGSTPGPSIRSEV